MSWEVKRIVVSWEAQEEETGKPVRVRCLGLLISHELALVVFDSHLEMHYVEKIPVFDEYQLCHASNPMFHVGKDKEQVIEDLQKMTFVEFSQKYKHSDFYLPPPEYSR